MSGNGMKTPRNGKTLITTLGAGVLALGAATLSQACGGVTAPAAQKQAAAAGAVAAVYHPGAFVKTGYEPGGFNHTPAIVGLWKFEMLSPDGSTVIDFGTSAWHSDGTELQMSGFHNPMETDVCQGVWEQVGERTFLLNHYALHWNAGSNYTGPVNIRARVTVDASGNHFSGNFITNVYAAAANVPGHEFDQTNLVASVSGNITGTRVVVQ